MHHVLSRLYSVSSVCNIPIPINLLLSSPESQFHHRLLSEAFPRLPCFFFYASVHLYQHQLNYIMCWVTCLSPSLDCKLLGERDSEPFISVLYKFGRGQAHRVALSNVWMIEWEWLAVLGSGFRTSHFGLLNFQLFFDQVTQSHYVILKGTEGFTGLEQH